MTPKKFAPKICHFASTRFCKLKKVVERFCKLKKVVELREIRRTESLHFNDFKS